MTGDSGKLWGGRFAAGVDAEIDRFTTALPVDRRLVRHDLVGCLAHARMLYEREILDREAAVAVLQGLSSILTQVEAGELVVEGAEEDVHSWIEARLIRLVGDPGRRLHTARSRNDQTSTALRLYVRDTLRERLHGLLELVEVWIEAARGQVETWLPGYTHLQRGQPTSLAHHLLAHAWAVLGDADRYVRSHDLAGISPLGAAALAGTPHPIDPHRSAELLGLAAPYANSMLAVADRDYVVETTFSCALLMTHLSRFASEVILWTSKEFGFATLGDEVSKGSSIMPQKRNPEVAEILRGKTARVVGDLTSLLVLLKGLPLTYNSDLQEDKEPLFDALDTCGGALGASRVLFLGMHFHPERMAAALVGGYLTATDLADGLVERGIPFRTAHEQTGHAVRAAEARGVELWELELEELQRHCPAADAAILARLVPEASVRSRASAGGPAPVRVEEQLTAATAAVTARREWLATREEPPIYRAYREGRLLDPDPLPAAPSEDRG